jgi:hypothetical protein
VASPARLRDAAQWLTHACRKDTLEQLLQRGRRSSEPRDQFPEALALRDFG